jgi:tetratricopeptide (TPR) repeat protein
VSQKHRRQKGRPEGESKAPGDPAQTRGSKRRGVRPSRAGRKGRAGDGQAAPQLPAGRRVWLFRVAALVLAPILFLGLMETGLRLAGYGFDPHATVKCQVNGQACRGDNIKFAWRFFSPLLAREFEPFAFPARKPAHTCRIFVLGASAAQGIPNHAFCFGRFLQVMLEERFPEIHFEVITAAMAAINSHVVREIAQECARYEPDLFVVYLGNNEVIGPYGPGTVLTPALSNLRLIRLGIVFRATRTGQLLAGLLGRYGSREGQPQYWQGMEMFLGRQVRASDPRLETTYDHFRRNLEDIGRMAARAGAETVVCTVGSNLKDCPPFASLHRPDLSPEQQASWDGAYRQGMDLEARGKDAEALAAYLRAAEIDDDYAEVQYRLGRCYWLTGEYGNAQARYLRARDLDTLRFRADTRINETIRTLAGRMKSRGVRLADVAEALDANSPHDLPGQEYFYEHVHLTFAGNYITARTVLAQAEPLIARRFGDAARPGGTAPTEEQCARRLAWNDWSRQETLHAVVHLFLAKPPFTNQAYHAEQVARLTQRLRALEASLTPQALQDIGSQYLAAIAAAPDDWRLRWDYGKLLAEDLKQYEASAAQYRVVQQFVPHAYIAHDALAAVLRAQGALEGAVAEYHKVLAAKPTSGSAYYYLGWCYLKQGRTEAAAAQFRKAVRFEPTCVPAYLDWGELLFRQGKLAEAVQVCRHGLAMVPNHPLLHSDLGMLLIKTGKRQEGAEEIRKALQLDPNSPQIRRVAETLLGPGAVR